MVLENVKEMWTEVPRLAGGKKGRPVNKDRFISKMYVDPTMEREMERWNNLGGGMAISRRI